MDKPIDINTLADPRDYHALFGDYALFGLYMRVYWESLELGEKVLANRSDKKLLAEHQSYENWLGVATDTLPEWAIDILHDIDAALDEDGL